MASIDLDSALKASNEKRFTTRPMRIAMWSFAAGYVAAVVSVSVNWGDLGGLFDRLRAGVEAVQDEPVPTTAPVAVTP